MPIASAPQEVLRKLEWRVRHVADSSLGGEYRTAFRGRGREFDQVVRYEWGDDIRDIDWNVTARLGEHHYHLTTTTGDLKLTTHDQLTSGDLFPAPRQ